MLQPVGAKVKPQAPFAVTSRFRIARFTRPDLRAALGRERR
jgi:hypothetical protein